MLFFLHFFSFSLYLSVKSYQIFYFFDICRMLPLTSVLEQQGFSPQEARVYLANLELGAVPVSMIARKLGENRVTVYSTIQGLVKKQLIFEVNKNKVMHYTALSPQKLLEKSQEKTSNLEAVMSTLLAMNLNADQKP